MDNHRWVIMQDGLAGRLPWWWERFCGPSHVHSTAFWLASPLQAWARSTRVTPNRNAPAKAIIGMQIGSLRTSGCVEAERRLCLDLTRSEMVDGSLSRVRDRTSSCLGSMLRAVDPNTAIRTSITHPGGCALPEMMREAWCVSNTGKPGQSVAGVPQKWQRNCGPVDTAEITHCGGIGLLLGALCRCGLSRSLR